ncbi:hypothetical protein BH23BAC1_BH23BAC1_26930 [soil metagenome]
MSNTGGTIANIGLELSKVLQPLKNELASGNARLFLAEIGIIVTPAQETSLSAPLQAIVNKTNDLISITGQLIAAIQSESYSEVGKKTLDLINIIKDLITGFTNLANAIKALGLGISQAVIDKIPERIFNYLLVKYFGAINGINEVLQFLGILEIQVTNAGSVDPNNPEYNISTFKFDRIVQWIDNPPQVLNDLYDWGKPSFTGRKLFENTEKLFAGFGLPVIYDESLTQPLLDLGLVEAVPKDQGIAAKLKPSLTTGLQQHEEDDWTIQFNADANLPVGVEILIQPNGNIVITPPSPGAIQGNMEVKWIGKRKGTPQPFVLIGQPGGSRLEIMEYMIGASTSLTFNAGKASGKFGFQSAVKGGKVVIDTSSGDGFLKKIIPGINLQSEFELLIGIATNKGLYFHGSGGLEIKLPTHITLGPIELQGLTIMLRPDGAAIPVSLGADIKAELGPMVAIVQNMGITASFSFPSGGGNLGPAKVEIGFKPPNGVGLSLDTGVIKGGGFLFLDNEKGEYAGALELTFQGFIELKAIGLINTKMPDGSSGFSLLIIITAEFTPIQLGFGFTLNGIGGLLGLNRTTKIEALREGVRTNAIKSILFPENVIANINRIISDLKQIFPPHEGHFIVGPMAKLGWGTPSIITLELGILIELPAPRIAILGVLKALLPEENTALIRIQVNFLGVIDFQNKFISFDATLFDSRIMILTLSGDMAFRLSWGDNSMFILSVGGFHPAFREIPDDLTRMRRLTISLLSGNNPRLTVEAYFAVTSNTVQFGAKVELYAAAAGFNIYGFLGFDVLFQFDPFKFIASIAAGIALRRGSSVLMSIRVSGTLSGPKPWDVVGEASFSILFFDLTISFHVTWGDRADKIEATKVNVLELLKKELQDVRNWKADIPDTNNLHVSIKEIKQPADKLIIHPFGVITFSERLVPLDYSINKFGNKKPDGDSKFEIKGVKSGSNSLTTQPIKEQFAPANFTELADSDKISRKSYESMNSGFKITASSALTIASIVEKSVDYELSYLVKKKRLIGGIFKFAKYAFQSILKSSAVSKSSLSYQVNKISTTAPLAVKVKQDKYAIANVSDLKMFKAGLLAESQAEAFQLYQQLIIENPALKNEIQVVSQFELNEV